MSESPARPFRHRKYRDRALILPLVGVSLLTPPLVTMFGLGQSWGGVPLSLLYLFAVWAVLIVGAALLARPLAEAEETEPRDGGPMPSTDRDGDSPP